MPMFNIISSLLSRSNTASNRPVATQNDLHIALSNETPDTSPPVNNNNIAPNLSHTSHVDDRSDASHPVKDNTIEFTSTIDNNDDICNKTSHGLKSDNLFNSNLCNDTLLRKQSDHSTKTSNFQNTLMCNNNDLISGFTEDIITTTKIEDLFVKGQVWINKKSLVESFTRYCGMQNVLLRATGTNSDTLRCNRQGSYRNKKQKNGNRCNIRQLSGGSIHTNCGFYLKMKSTQTKKVQGSKRCYTRPLFDDNTPVKIDSFSFAHTNGCNPCPQQYQFVMSRTGSYIKGTNRRAMFDICSYQKTKGRVPSSYIRHVLQRIFPIDKNVTKQDVYYMRLRCRRLLPLLASDQSFEEFEKVVSDSDIPHDYRYNTIIDNDDEACAVAKDIWIDFLNEDSTNCDSAASFQTYLKLISQNAKGFSYKLSYDNQMCITGVVWMTSTMRSSFERFGSYIALDTMKRGLNTLLWPYLAVTMQNEL